MRTNGIKEKLQAGLANMLKNRKATRIGEKEMQLNLSKRVLSVVLCLALLMAYVPVWALTASAASGSTSIADPKTLSLWQTWFPEGSSRAAGSIFVDKSVYTATEAKTDAYFADIRDSLTFGEDNFGNENFMVALSALGSNSEVYGYSYNPTDTMLVLDASTSMGTGDEASSSVDDMVRGANEAVKRLLSLNNYNRVGVVIYNGSASVLLPLDRYETSGDILRFERSVTGGSGGWPIFGSNSSENRIYIASGVKDSDGAAVATNYVAQGQGTYTQGGVYTAAQQLLNADTVIEDGKIQGGTKRIPIMVLMSDGEPSYRTQTGSNTTIDRYNAATNANVDRSNFLEDDVTAFSTMLTAAWAEAEITAHYGMDTRFYTLGYALSANHQYALNVLDPMNPNNASAQRFISYADQYLAADQNETVAIRNNNQTAFRVTRLTSPRQVTTLDYVDRFWQASQADQLQMAFDVIVDEIVIQSRYYSTLVSSKNYAQDGFVSFTDALGDYMEVKDVKGIYIGDGKLVSGGMFAEFATTGSLEDYNNTQYDDSQLNGFENEILSAVAERFSISLSEAFLLLDSAKDSGFISYTSPTEFSNYIAWYADADNNYLAPYTTSGVAAQSNAKYIVRSYFYMGDVTQNHVETSMLYALVRVREEIATGNQIVDMNVPAALLPMVTYTITVDGDTLTSENITGITSVRKNPVSLLFEVGVDSEITPINIEEKVGNSIHKNANGTYTFYTNRWTDAAGNPFTIPQTVDPHIFYYGETNTTVTQFIPSLENQRFYYTENMQILNGSHQVYTGAKPTANGEYYIAYSWVEGNGTAAELKTAYNKVPAEVLSDPDNIIQISGKTGWFIKAGTPQHYFGEEVHGEQAHSHKTENPTQTLGFSGYPKLVYHDSEEHNGYHILNYHGNNGMVQAAPAQGIKLSKTVSQTVAGAPDAFDFEITLGGAALANSYPVYIEHADGTSTTATAQVSGSKLALTLSDGDVAYIYDLPDNTTYTVKEAYSAYYTASSANASGTVAHHVLSAVDFVNAPKGYGSLRIEKKVSYPFSTVPTEISNQDFSIVAEFTGDADDLAQISAPAGFTPVTSGNSYTYTFTLKNDDDALFTDIPDGVEYTVQETNLPAGYTLTTAPAELAGMITTDIQSEALLINTYTAAAVSPSISVIGEKYLEGRAWDTQVDRYQVALQQVNFGGQGVVAVGQPTIVNVEKADGPDYRIDMSSIVYTAPGTYSYVVYEVSGNVDSVAYDASFAIFTVTVADKGTGALAIENVTAQQQTATVSETSTGVWTVTKDFTNNYQSVTVRIPVTKQVLLENSSTAVQNHRGGIVLALYAAADATTPAYTTMTDKNGNAAFVFPVKRSGYETAKYYYLREILPSLDAQVVGMTYNTAIAYVIGIDWSNAGNDAPVVTYYRYDANAANGVGAAVSSALTITNTYEENAVSNGIALGGVKTLNGGALRAGDSFTIELYETDSTFSITGKTPVATRVVNGQTTGGAYLFENITFDAEGTKYLVIREANGGTTANGITYDNAVYHITVDVAKMISSNKTGLSASVSSIHKVGSSTITANNALNFNNTYVASGRESVVITGNKVLSGRHLIEGEFLFEIVAETPNAPMPSVTVVRNDVDGSFAFPAIRYAVTGTHGFSQTYNYTIREVVPAAGEDLKGITFNSDNKTAYSLSVTLADDGNGGVTKTVLLDGAAVTNVQVAFQNSYAAADTQLTLGGTKHFNQSRGQFRIDLYDASSSFIIGQLVTSADVTVTDGEGPFTITLDYTSADRGYHYYVLKEFVPADTGRVRYDATEYHITVNVLDNGNGEMEARVMSIVKANTTETATETTLDFTNVYVPKPEDISINVSVDKTVVNKGSESIGPEGFQFQLEDTTSGEKLTVKTDKDGKAIFRLVYTEEDAGKTYTYKVTELNGGKENVTYSTKSYTITVSVALTQTNELVATLTQDGEAVSNVATAFENVYDYTPEPPVPESPKTGDTTHLALWFTLLFVSGGGVLATFIYNKKQEETAE